MTLLPAAAAAQANRAPAPDAVPDDEAIARTAAIARALDAGEADAQRWFWFWTGVSAVAAVGEGLGAGLFALEPDGRVRLAWQPGLVVGAAVAAAGLLPAALAPMQAAFAPGVLRRAPAATPDERARRLRLAERLLRTSAEGEAAGRSWISHVAGLGVALVSAGVVWIWLAAEGAPLETQLINVAAAAAGTALFSEVQIFTQPTAAVAAWRDQAGARRAPPPRLSLTLAPGTTRTTLGLALSY